MIKWKIINGKRITRIKDIKITLLKLDKGGGFTALFNKNEERYRINFKSLKQAKLWAKGFLNEKEINSKNN